MYSLRVYRAWRLHVTAPHAASRWRLATRKVAVPLGLFLVVSGLASQAWAQASWQPDGDIASDAVLRQRIERLYPRRMPDVDHPWFNPSSAAKIRLGRMLFFDPNLSRCGTIACASCHHPAYGFASPYPVPPGCDGVRGRRRAPTLYNVAYQSHFFWDGRVQSLEQQALFPIGSAAEMGNTWDAVLRYLNTGQHGPSGKVDAHRREAYTQHFADVFNGAITPITVSRALAAFERTIVTRDAPFDRWLDGDDTVLTPLQKRGLDVFFGRANCAVCHPPPLFTDDAFHNIAVPQAGFETPDLFPHNAAILTAAQAQGWTVPAAVDLGRQETPPLQSATHALGAFKTPTLRNVTRHQPYMHNGVFSTLEAVMQHYEQLAAGDIEPLVGKLAFYVRYRKAFFGARGGGAADDIAAMVAFMSALEGTTPEVSGPENHTHPSP